MAFTNTAKWALRRLTGASLVSDIDAGFTALADDIDPLLTPYTEGVAASRPVSTTGSPGKQGREYRSTDTGVIEKDTGTSWVPLGGVARYGAHAPGAVVPLTTSFADYATLATALPAGVWAITAEIDINVNTAGLVGIDARLNAPTASLTTTGRRAIQIDSSSGGDYAGILLDQFTLSVASDVRLQLKSPAGANGRYNGVRAQIFTSV